MANTSTTFLGNSLEVWIIAIMLSIGVFYSVQFLSNYLSKKLDKATFISFPTRIALSSSLKINWLLLIVLSLVAGFSIVSLTPEVKGTLYRVLFFAVCLQLGLWATSIVWALCVTGESREKAVYRSSAHGLLVIVAKAVIWVLLFLLVLDNWGINITALIAGLGIGGVAVALAVQNILGDIFASLAIVLDKPFELGDFIVVDDIAGSIENIGVKTTRIRSLSGEQIVLSNSSLLTNRIRNFKRMFERRVVFGFNLTYDTPTEKLTWVSEKIREIIQSESPVRFDRAHFKSLGAYSLEFEVVYFVLSPNYNLYMDIQQRINLTLKRTLEDANIMFALPARTIHMDAPPHSSRLSAAAN